LIAITGIAAAHAAAALVAIAAARRAIGRSVTWWPLDEPMALFACVPTLILSGIFILAAWDVDRYFIQTTPYLVMITALLVTPLSRTLAAAGRSARAMTGASLA
jgi:hypothetical protein